MVAYQRDRSRQVFAATAGNVAAYAASGNVAELRFSDHQRDQVGDQHTRRYLDPDAQPAAPASNKSGASPKKTRGKRKETTRSSVDDFGLS